MPTTSPLRSKSTRRAVPDVSASEITSGSIERPLKSVKHVGDLGEVFTPVTTVQVNSRSLTAHEG